MGLKERIERAVKAAGLRLMQWTHEESKALQAGGVVTTTTHEVVAMVMDEENNFGTISLRMLYR